VYTIPCIIVCIHVNVCVYTRMCVSSQRSWALIDPEVRKDICYFASISGNA